MSPVLGGREGESLAGFERSYAAYPVAGWFLDHGHRVARWDVEAETQFKTETTLNGAQRVLAVHCDVSQAQWLTRLRPPRLAA